jgi:hypothetical protein
MMRDTQAANLRWNAWTAIFSASLIVGGGELLNPTITTGQSSATTPPGESTADQPSGRALETLRQLEQEGSVLPEEVPASTPMLDPKERAKEHLQEMEEQYERDKVSEQEEQTPIERAREKVQQLEQVESVDDERDRVQDLELHPVEKNKKTVKEASRPPQVKERVKHLLGVYETRIGIYDEILDTTRVGPGLLHQALGAPDWLVIGGEHRTRYEGLDGSWRTNEPNGGQLVSMRTRLQIGIQNIVDPLRFLIEIQDSRLPLTTTGAYGNINNANELDIQQLHVDLVSKNIFGTGVPSLLKVGRINMDVGRGRWIARNQFRNATNAFDGFEWQLGGGQRWQLRSFLFQPVQRFVRKLDPWFSSDASTFWGAYIESHLLPWFDTSFHYFGHRSKGPGRDFDMLGGRVVKEPETGEVDYEFEVSYQFGNITPQTRFAQFYHAEIGYTFDMPGKPQTLLKFDYASNGFDILYGRRSFELHPTGIFGPFQRSNMASPGIRLLVQPLSRSYVFVQYRAWWLADDRGSWVGTGLQDPSGRSGNFVGQTFELRARWSLKDNLYLQAGYAHFAFGPFAERVPSSPVTRDAHYGYFWTEFMF